MLDLDSLERVRPRGGKIVARCPACAEMGADRRGEHLMIDPDGRFACATNQGKVGHAHRQRIWELAGRLDGPRSPIWAPFAIPAYQKKGSPRLPALRPLTAKEMAAIALARRWPSEAGLELLTRRRLLWYGEVWDAGRNWPAWIVTDSNRRNAQARRLDGLPWSCGKAKTIPGSTASWPVGAADIGDRPIVVLVEGGPDLLAIFSVVCWERNGGSVGDIAPVCLTGAGQTIARDALDYFRGKRVRIAVHDDDIGRAGGCRWASQLRNAGAGVVDGFGFDGLEREDGQPVNDLADFATLLNPDNPPGVQFTEGLFLPRMHDQLT